MPLTAEFPPINCYDKSFAVANAAQISTTPLDLSGCSLAGLIFPAAMTSNSVKFKVSNAIDGTYVFLQDGAGSDYSKTIGSSIAITLDPAVFFPWRFVHIYLGTAETGAKTVGAVTRPV